MVGAAPDCIPQSPPPGVYVKLTGYPPTFAPDVTDARAARVVELRSGAHLDNVDVIVDLGSGARVDGTVFRADGNPVVDGVVLLARPDAIVRLAPRLARYRTDGRFSFGDLAPGSYTVFVPPARLLEGGDSWAESRVEVGAARQQQHITLALRSTTVLSGRVTFEGRPSPLPGVFVPTSVTARPVGRLRAIASIESDLTDEDGLFRLDGLVAGEYDLRATTDNNGYGWHVESILVPDLAPGATGTVEALDGPIRISAGQDVFGVQVVFSAVTTSVTAHVQSPGATGPLVMSVFAEEARYWTPGSRRVALTAFDQTGVAHLDGLPPGKYLAVALPAARVPSDWPAPARLEAWRMSATGFVLEPGAKVDLRLTILTKDAPKHEQGVGRNQ